MHAQMNHFPQYPFNLPGYQPNQFPMIGPMYNGFLNKPLYPNLVTINSNDKTLLSDTLQGVTEKDDDSKFYLNTNDFKNHVNPFLFIESCVEEIKRDEASMLHHLASSKIVYAGNYLSYITALINYKCFNDKNTDYRYFNELGRYLNRETTNFPSGYLNIFITTTDENPEVDFLKIPTLVEGFDLKPNMVLQPNNATNNGVNIRLRFDENGKHGLTCDELVNKIKNLTKLIIPNPFFNFPK